MLFHFLIRLRAMTITQPIRNKTNLLKLSGKKNRIVQLITSVCCTPVFFRKSMTAIHLKSKCGTIICHKMIDKLDIPYFLVPELIHPLRCKVVDLLHSSHCVTSFPSLVHASLSSWFMAHIQKIFNFIIRYTASLAEKVQLIHRKGNIDLELL